MKESREAYQFNAAQRAHAHLLENMSQTLLYMLVAGLVYPRTSATLGVGWVVSRILFCYGYITRYVQKAPFCHITKLTLLQHQAAWQWPLSWWDILAVPGWSLGSMLRGRLQASQRRLAVDSTFERQLVSAGLRIFRTEALHSTASISQIRSCTYSAAVRCHLVL